MILEHLVTVKMISHDDVVYPVPKHIKDFAISRGMPITQVNGQRLYGPSQCCAVAGMLPLAFTEVYVSNLPKCIHEPDLVPILESVGPFYQLRLLMNYSGNNRGFCFVTYFSPQQADTAVAYLNGLTFPRDTRNKLIACRAFNNKRLILGGIPSYKTLPEIYMELSLYHPGVTCVQTAGFTNPGATKCLILADYISQLMAAKARRKMLSQKCYLWGFKITVDWAEPEVVQLPVGYRCCNQPDVLHVENLTSTTTIKTLKNLFNGVKSVRMFREQNRAVIFFTTRGQAEAAKLVTNEMILDGNKIRVGWCHPGIISGRRRQSETENMEQEIGAEAGNGNHSPLTEPHSEPSGSTVEATATITSAAIENNVPESSQS